MFQTCERCLVKKNGLNFKIKDLKVDTTTIYISVISWLVCGIIMGGMAHVSYHVQILILKFLLYMDVGPTTNHGSSTLRIWFGNNRLFWWNNLIISPIIWSSGYTKKFQYWVHWSDRTNLFFSYLLWNNDKTLKTHRSISILNIYYEIN